MEANLQGLTVLAYEARRAEEIAELVRRCGGKPIVVPAVREVPAPDARAIRFLLDGLAAGRIEAVVFLTGVGTRLLLEAASSMETRDSLVARLRSARLVARGPKPVAALRAFGLEPNIQVPKPNTWREVLASLDARGSVRGRAVAVQEYGRASLELIEGLRERGADVLRVPVYRWDLPADREPLRESVRRVLRGEIGAILFTSAVQVEHLMQTAVEMRLRGALLEAVRAVVIGSVGPVCSQALREHGFPVDVDPPHPKMGQLVAAVAERAVRLLPVKRHPERRRH